MQLTVIRADDSVTHLALSGRLDVQGVNAVQNQFSFQATARHRATLVDLSEVTFMASLGIGMLVESARALRHRGVKMVLLAPTADVRKTLEAAGIHQVIPIAATADAASALLQ